MICATCGRNNGDHLVFCEDCGARLAPRVAPPTPPIGIPMQPPAASPPAAAAGIACPRCGASNAAGMRFCITCGSPLETRPAGPSMPAPIAAPPPATPARPATPPQPAAPVPAPTPSPGIAGPAPAIAPVPVVGLGTPAPQVATRACKRCRGMSDANAQFCRFCGAPLGDGKDTEPIPAVHAMTPGQPVSPPAAPTPRLDATLLSGPPAGMAPAAPSAPTPAAAQAVPAAAAPAADHEQAPDETKVIKAYQGESAPAGRLVLIAKDGGEGPSFPILDQLDVGRSDGEATFDEDRYLAPRHARIVRIGDRLHVRDLGSPNGVYLRLRNKAKGATEYAGEAPLVDQDLILIGQQVLRFEIVKDAEEGFGAASEHGTLVFGTPAAPRYARLCQRTTEGVARDVFHLHKAETVLGRESGDIVFTEDPFLSRRHAAIRMDDPQTFSLLDMDSSNGTFVRIRGEVALEDGDELRMGQELFRIDLTSLGGRGAMPSASDGERTPA